MAGQEENQEVKTIEDAFAAESEEAQGTPIGREQAGAVETAGAPRKWSEFGLDRYDKMDREKIAADINYRNKLYGDQSNEIGTIRQERDALKAKIEQMTAISTGKGSEVSDEIEAMTPGQLTDFYEQFEKNPRKAIMSLLGDKVKGGRSDEDLKKIIAENIREALFQYHGFSEQEGVKRNRPEYVEHEPYIEILSGEKYLGGIRSTNDILDFAILEKENATLAPIVYDKLKRYPNMSFADCRKFSELELRSQDTEQAKKDELKSKVAGLQGAGAGMSTAKGKASETDNVTTMDEAFDMD